MQPHTYCHFCGAKHVSEKWPRTCGVCKQTTWKNPLPVVVALVPIGSGVLTVRRNIHPGFGELALPGGYMDDGETWQEAAAREVLEETGLCFVPDDFKEFGLGSSSNRAHFMVFCVASRRFDAAAIHDFLPNAEVQDLTIVHRPIGLAFPLHTEMLARYLGA